MLCYFLQVLIIVYSSIFKLFYGFIGLFYFWFLCCLIGYYGIVLVVEELFKVVENIVGVFINKYCSILFKQLIFEVINYGDFFVIVLVEGYFVGLCLGFNDFDVGEM